MKRGLLIELLRAHEVNRLSANDAWQSFFAMDPNALPDRDDTIVSADCAEEQEPALVDMVNDEADLIQVACE
jgi:hypothetical protein